MELNYFRSNINSVNGIENFNKISNRKILIYKKKFNNKNEAMSFEYKLKKDKKKRKDIIKNFIK